MPQRETIGRTVGKAAGKTGAWIAGGVLLCSLAAAQFSQAAQQLQAQPNAVRQQLSQAGQVASSKAQTAAPAAAPKTAPAPKPAAAPNGSAAQKPAQTGPAKPAAGATATPAAAASTKPVAGRRDPFAALLKETDKTGGIPEHLPPGKAGLVIATLRVDGIVRGPNGMIAIVSNSQQRVYFLREGDRLYDGSVNHITMTDVSFHESGKDPFGKPVEREVSKPLLNATPGEAQ